MNAVSAYQAPPVADLSKGTPCEAPNEYLERMFAQRPASIRIVTNTKNGTTEITSPYSRNAFQNMSQLDPMATWDGIRKVWIVKTKDNTRDAAIALFKAIYMNKRIDVEEV